MGMNCLRLTHRRLPPVPFGRAALRVDRRSEPLAALSPYLFCAAKRREAAKAVLVNGSSRLKLWAIGVSWKTVEAKLQGRGKAPGA